MENKLNSMEKYYTPSIEDLNVGAECEITWNNNEQNENSFGELYDNTYFYQEKITPQFIALFENDKHFSIRFKYLDKSDIESLGFQEEFIPNCYLDDDNIEEGYQLFISNTDMLFIHLNKDGKYGIVRQHIYNLNTLNWTAENLFYGTIKNKSELVKLLKQLGINA